MASGFTLDGQQQVLERLRRLEQQLPTALATALYERASEIMARSRPLVPVVTGALRSSGVVYPPEIEGGRVSVVFGYGGAASAYAAPVHWNPRSGHTGGRSPSGRKYKEGTYSTVGQWRYLSEPLEEVQRTLTQDMGQMVTDILQRIK